MDNAPADGLETMSNLIPNKIFFKIGEVAKIADIETHVLRYWESEFKELNPQKDTNGQRVYRKKDVEKVLEIKKLLYDERFSIEGAKKKLSRKNNLDCNYDLIIENLKTIKNELSEILNVLN